MNMTISVNEEWNSQVTSAAKLLNTDKSKLIRRAVSLYIENAVKTETVLPADADPDAQPVTFVTVSK